MQKDTTLISIIQRDRPDVPLDTIQNWVTYLQQLNGCHLFSAKAPDVDKKAWLKERRAGIGGSEIATLLGENHWSSPRQIWLSKIGTTDEDPPPQNESAMWGNILETVVAKEWARRTGRKWIHIPVIIQSDTESWLLANIDGFTLDDTGKIITGILEIKTTSLYNLEAWQEGPLPYNYVCQANWYAGITQLPEIELVCLVGGQTLCYHTLPADTALFERERIAAADFWQNNVLKGIEPPATEVDVALVKKGSETQDETLPPLVLDDDESERLTEAYCALREKIAALDKVKKALYAQIFLMLGKNTQAITTTHTIVFKTSARRSCNFDLLMDEYPEAYKKCVATTFSNSLTIK